MKIHEPFLIKNFKFFTDSLKSGEPYIANTPRNHHSLFLVTKGNLTYERENMSSVIREGEVGYIESGFCDKSSAHLCDEVSYIATNFDLTDTEGNPISLPFGALCTTYDTSIFKRLFKEGLDAYLLKNEGYRTVACGILMTVIGRLAEKLDADSGIRKKRERLSRAIEHIKEHYGSRELSIKELAALSFMSEKNFRRLFAEAYGTSPFSYLQRFRVARAKVLLSDTEKSISDIAIFCGFADLYSFSHSFKKHTGISPREYREKHI